MPGISIYWGQAGGTLNSQWRKRALVTVGIHQQPGLQLLVGWARFTCVCVFFLGGGLQIKKSCDVKELTSPICFFGVHRHVPNWRSALAVGRTKPFWNEKYQHRWSRFSWMKQNCIRSPNFARSPSGNNHISHQSGKRKIIIFKHTLMVQKSGEKTTVWKYKTLYSPEIEHRTWKWWFPKGISFSGDFGLQVFYVKFQGCKAMDFNYRYLNWWVDHRISSDFHIYPGLLGWR